MPLLAARVPLPCRKCLSLSSRTSLGKQHRTVVISTATPPSSNGAPPKPSPLINEDVLARLKAAEEEAARLRQELAAAQAGKQGSSPVDVIEGKLSRIDGTGNRETLAFAGSLYAGQEDLLAQNSILIHFVCSRIETGETCCFLAGRAKYARRYMYFTPAEAKGKRSSWLTEADVDFFTGGGPGEEVPGNTAAEQEASGAVTKRLLIGILATAGLAAFALIPTSQLQLRPTKPLYFYVVPLLRIQALLNESGAIIQDADWEQLRLVLRRVVESPNYVRESIDSIIALQTDGRVAQRVEAVGLDLVGFVKQMDYNNYYDAIPVRKLTSTQNLQFVDYSSRALKAAQAKLAELLALLPSSAVQQARDAMQI